MERLDDLRRKSFTEEDFERYPVWTPGDEEDEYRPISEAEPSPENHGTLLIKAQFQLNGRWLNGYLIGGPTFYAFGIFVNGREFVINLNLPTLNEKCFTEICRLLNWQSVNLFPVRYRSEVRFQGGRPIRGTLTP
jgi:hypothetical protein